MGLFDKVKSKLESALDGGDAHSGSHDWPADQPWARLVESEYRPGSSQNTSSDGGGLIDIAIDAVGGIPYRFVLEVHRPGVETYHLPQERRIPSKVERTLMQGAQYVQKGTEVPLTVSGPAPEDVEIDWEAYLVRPGRREEQQRLGGEIQQERLGADFDKNHKPKQAAKIRENGRIAAFSLVDMVVAGQMSRADFDLHLDPLRKMGQLTQEDYDAAVARIEAAQ